MLNEIIFGLLLGWGAAIPIGPINLEIIRRNLNLGTSYGVMLGMGACSADVTYLILLSWGTLAILTYPLAMQVIGVSGSLILAWFGYSALRMPTPTNNNRQNNRSYPAWRHGIEGYFMTLLNPMTILFWSSVSAQVAIRSDEQAGLVWYAGAGVLIGALSWSMGLNVVLHYTRHRLPEKTMHYLNYAGGIILLGFAAMGFWRAFA